MERGKISLQSEHGNYVGLHRLAPNHLCGQKPSIQPSAHADGAFIGVHFSINK